MTLIPLALFGVLEGSLRLAGYGYSTAFFVDGSHVEGREVWIDNPNFERWVFPPALQDVSRPVPFALPRSKAPGTYRIFVLGESAAMGFPEPSFSFARVLEAMLRDRYPETRFEIVNTAMVAINSHVVLPIARQCVQHEPDLFIVHLGNNEVVGPFGAAGVLGPFSPRRGLIRANLAVKTTRAGQMLNRFMQSFGQSNQSPRAWQGMSTFAGSHVRAEDDRLNRIYGHFRENLEDICRVGADAGVPVIVCTIPVNLKDSAPFGSLHDPALADKQLKAWTKAYTEGMRLENDKKHAEAIRCYEEASRIDDHYADLAFRLGRCYAALGKKSEAKEYFVRARDLDTLRFRSDTTINRTIREVISGQKDERILLADAESAFERSSPDGIPGEELFLEHVHMNFKGNWLLARTIFERITELAPATLGGGNTQEGQPLSEQECAERLAYTQWNERKIVEEITGMLTTQQPFTGQLDHLERGMRWEAKKRTLKAYLERDGWPKAFRTYQKAMEQTEGDWMMRVNYGQLLMEARQVPAAEEQFVQALVILRHDATIRVRLGQLYLTAGRVDEAAGNFREAARLDPGLMSAYFGLAQAHLARGETSEAIALCEEQVRKGSNRLIALIELGKCLARAGKLSEAEERFAEALHMSPRNRRVLVSLGDVAYEQKKWSESVEHYEAALRIWPEWPELRLQLDRARKKREEEKSK
jgi:tetratricopeptide (TPR) repeat protein